MIDQHAPSPEAHHTHATLEHEAFIVRGGDAWLERLSTPCAICLLGFSLRIVHSLHVFPQFVLPLKLLATCRTEKVFAVRVPEHVQT